MAYPGPPRRAAGLLRYIFLAVVIVVILGYLRQYHTQTALGDSSTYVPSVDTKPPPTADKPAAPPIPVEPGAKDPAASGPITTPAVQGPVSTPAVEQPTTKPAVKEPSVKEPITKPATSSHPIDELIIAGEKVLEDLLTKESKDLKTAAAEYRKRRGRHPPPGFDVWFKFAQENGAIMVEDFFDQIYHDLGPFWGVAPATMRKESWDYEMTINIRNKNASAGSAWFWTQIWLNLTQTIEHMLPDMDLPLNAMDEPRVVVPWEKINEYMETERSTRSMPPANEVISEFQSRPNPGQADLDVKTRPKKWKEVRPYWKVASRGCHPDSLARKATVMSDFSHIPDISLAHTASHTYKGYVSNFSLSSEFCHQPDLQSLHGMMIDPLSVSASDVLSPMFGGSKLPTNNEILLPAPMYWNNEERFSGGDDHGDPWDKKLDKVIWRGVATGGRNRPTNWKGFQRHRFVAMTNATQVSQAENWAATPQNWALPSSQYNLASQQENRLGEWTGQWADTGFVDLMCVVPQAKGFCNYTSPYFSLTKGMKMAEQFDRKYLPDIDGNSFSGRYRGFLMSTSLPIKATIFKEWHDSRLVPWVHFVPMDNRFMDFWGIMEYFLGYEGETIKVEGHDAAAEKIATAGQTWANKVLRREDMQIYVHRLLLEYARIGDDNRHKLGYVADLL